MSIINRVERTDWGARVPKWKTLDDTTIGVAIHYSAGVVKNDHADCPSQVRAIQNYHMDQRGWSDIAYNYVVCNHGYVFVGRDWGVRDGAQGTEWGTTNYHSICWLGGPQDTVSDLAIDRLHEIYNESVRLGYGADIKPHSFFKSTQCPGDDMRSKLNKIKEGNRLANHVTSNPSFQPAFDAAVKAGMFTAFTNVDDVLTAEKLAVFLARVGIITVP